MPNMIRVRCQRNDGKIINLEVKGHANSDIYGKDLVCAAVSAILFGGLNALENPKAFEIHSNEKSGELTLNVIGDVTTHDYDVLDVILTQLKTVEESNKDYVQIVEKGQ